MICLGLLFKFRETVKEHMDDEAAFIRRLKKSFIYMLLLSEQNNQNGMSINYVVGFPVCTYFIFKLHTFITEKYEHSGIKAKT